MPDDQYRDWSGQLIESGLAAYEAGDRRLIREVARACLIRPGRGVPPPRSGLLRSLWCSTLANVTHCQSYRCKSRKTAVAHGDRRGTRQKR